MNRVIDFYATVTSCQNTARECPNTVNMNRLDNEPSTLAWDSPPRGFYTVGKPEDILVMLVAKNPGHIINTEIGYYRDCSSKEIAKRHIELSHEFFTHTAKTQPQEKRSLVFHKNILNYMSFLLDVSSNEVFQHCVLTDLVKCSTIGEQDRLRRNTINQCFQYHFVREINFFNPRVIIAFGREVERFLKSQIERHRKPVVYIKHPSYHYRKEQKDSELAKIKLQLKKYIEQDIIPQQ